jgi:hypothetical protein
MPLFKLEDKSFDYYMALCDIGDFVSLCRERDWAHSDVTEAVKALGREGMKRMDTILEDMRTRAMIRSAAEEIIRKED